MKACRTCFVFVATMALVFATLELGCSDGEALAASSKGPSFDCKRATARDEKLICSNSALSQLDRELANAYAKRRSALPEPDRVKFQLGQKTWLQARSAMCLARDPGDERLWFGDHPTKCLANLYDLRIRQISDESEDIALTHWQAETTTARSITGDLLLSDTTITFGTAKSLRLQLVRDLPQNHALDHGAFGEARLLRLFKVSNPQPLKLIRNELCGRDSSAHYFVMAESGDRLEVATFKREPSWEKDYLDHTYDFCGTFGYSRPR